jgi:hypothetical protein
LEKVSTPQSFRRSPETFDKLYRGEPEFEGAPPPNGIPWDIHQAQPRLMAPAVVGAATGDETHSLPHQPDDRRRQIGTDGQSQDTLHDSDSTN